MREGGLSVSGKYQKSDFCISLVFRGFWYRYEKAKMLFIHLAEGDQCPPCASDMYISSVRDQDQEPGNRRCPSHTISVVSRATSTRRVHQLRAQGLVSCRILSRGCTITAKPPRAEGKCVRRWTLDSERVCGDM